MTLVPVCLECSRLLPGGFETEACEWEDGVPRTWRLICPHCRAVCGVRLADGELDLDLMGAFAKPVVSDPGPGVPSPES